MFESVVLPGAVLSEERVHLSGGRLEVDAVVRDDARKALRDPAHPHGRCRRGAGRAGASLAHVGRGGSAPPPA